MMKPWKPTIWIVIVTVAMVMLGIASCDQVTTPTSTPTPPETENTNTSGLLRALSKIPASFRDNGVVYGNWHRALDVTGAPRISSFEDYRNLDPSEREAYDGAVSNIVSSAGVTQGLKVYVTEWEQVFGLSRFQVSQSVGAGSELVSPPWSNPSYLEGSFDVATIRQRLLDLGYTEMEAFGYSYYSIRDDYQASLRDPSSRYSMNSMNRVFVGDGLLVSSPATEQMEAFLKVEAGEVPSLAEDRAFSSLAEALGDPLSAVIMTVSSVWGSIEDNLAAYEKPTDWGELHHWDVFATGYGEASGGHRWWKFSLFYTDPDAAELDVSELVQRMHGKQGSPATGPSFDDVCDSLSSHVEKGPGGSTLTVQCDLKPSTEESWFMLVQKRELGFLVP